jgi:hypothetical protein
LRRLFSFLGVVATTPVLLAVPVLTRPAVSPHPVSPRVAEVAVSPLPSTRGVLADTGQRATKSFTLAGVSWRRGTLAAGTHIELRTRSHGTWSSWTTLGTPDEAPDNGSPDARRAARLGTADSDPVWVGRADGVQARVVDSAGRSATAPGDLHVVLVDGGSSAGDASPGPAQPLGGAVANAEQAQPTIYTRAQWGADESLRLSACPKGPDYSSTIKMGFIHHTDGVNGYTRSQVPSILRSIYAYHVKSNGWCDIGYNFLVDRFGRIWEGRYGGITKAVIGAHTGGFNTDSFGTSLIGNYGSTTPSSAMLAAVEKLFAWKLGMYYIDPRATAVMKAASFSGSKYAAGTLHTFNVISGHRDADYTTCPGAAAYSKLASVRTAATAFIGAGFVAPSVSPTSVRMLTSGASFQVHSGVLGDQSWTLTVADSLGATVKTLSGTASTAAPVTAAWDLTGADGTPAPPGTYTLTLTGANSAGVADRPFTTTVTVTPPVTITGPATVAYGAPVTLSGVGTSVDLTLTRLADNTTSSPAVTYAGDGTWSAKFTADGDYSWAASVHGYPYTTQTSTTRIAPDVTTPTLPVNRQLFVAKGGGVTLGGTSLPGGQVAAVETPVGGSPVAGAPVTVSASGTWNGVTVTPATATTVSVQRVGDKGPDASLAAPNLTVYPVDVVTATAPTSGYAQRALAVTGNAGGAPLAIQLSLRPSGGSWTVASTVQASPTGTFTARALLPATTSVTSVAWRLAATGGGTTWGTKSGTVTDNPLFAPTARSARTTTYRHGVRVHGTAVPGDPVRLYTRPVSGGRWTRVSTTTASATGAFGPTFTLVRDTAWRITTPTGAVSGSVYMRPTLRAPRTAKRGAYVYVSGYAMPGQRVYVYKRAVGTTRWGRAVVSTVARSSGYWVARFRFRTSVNVVAKLHRQLSGIATIRLA